MATQNERLAVRTILVTTRAAVRINHGAGNEVLAHGSVRRGLGLLEEYEREHAADSRDEELTKLIDATRAELKALASQMGQGDASLTALDEASPTASDAPASAQPARGET